MSSVLEEERRGRVLVLRLNRRDARNALSIELMAALVAALARAEADPDVGAVVLTGTGDRSFCAGMDLREFAAGADVDDELRPRAIAGFQRFMGGSVTVPWSARPTHRRWPAGSRCCWRATSSWRRAMPASGSRRSSAACSPAATGPSWARASRSPWPWSWRSPETWSTPNGPGRSGS